jgi:predicted nuclease with TOPRIM domain
MSVPKIISTTSKRAHVRLHLLIILNYITIPFVALNIDDLTSKFQPDIVNAEPTDAKIVRLVKSNNVVESVARSEDDLQSVHQKLAEAQREAEKYRLQLLQKEQEAEKYRKKLQSLTKSGQ